jgi:hypothetical protein
MKNVQTNCCRGLCGLDYGRVRMSMGMGGLVQPVDVWCMTGLGAKTLSKSHQRQEPQY